jgi:hypothetical protein
MDLEIPLPLYNRLLEIGGIKRSHGFFTDTIVAALEVYLPRLEKPRTQDTKEEDTWLDQLIEDTTRKKR